MRILISLLFICSFAFADDMKQLEAEYKLIKEDFLYKIPKGITLEKHKKSLVRSKDGPMDKNIPNLEALYFDSISTKAAAPIRKSNKKIRSR